MIRPYLPPPRLARATVRRVPRRGRSPDADAAARRDQAAAIVRDEPAISGAELGRRLGIGPSWGFKLLAEVRATVPGVEAPPPIGPGKVVRLRQATIERLAAVTGRPIGEDLDGQAMECAEEVLRLRGVVR